MPKPPHPDNEYFGKMDIKKKKKLADDKAEATSKFEEKSLHDLHWHKCPECGHDMKDYSFKGYTIAKCSNCQGAFLQAEVLRGLCGEDSQIIESIMDVFGFKE
jgi:hypothetical protein